ncbi:FAD-dependent oxidoreductase [Jongsikchunia kroppenstedtii]|uniref:FAD-dependent oxidoreductase n=1 Tax=Jongsikchunia kroppenstedtii TaxID=1121721 RepID=UPI000370C72E|nr:FAD-dependent oxidoreductase [Jongsikchunia kroppenstedtii]
MPHVITQPCCNDASCISVCPVNCIHPTPDEPDFATAEMLYIDPDTCIDCGACIDECPVEAIFPDDNLNDDTERYLQINADYYTDHDVSGGLVPPRKAKPLPADQQLSVAIVGAGPAAFYAAEELVKHNAVTVDMFDRLPTPYGLVRAGVAPDHVSTKGVEATYATTANKRNFNYLLNVTVGEHITPAELTERYGAVVYAVGAPTDKHLGVEGEDLPGSISATAFVAWYNGHPDYVDFDVDLSGERAVVVGNGNVALDVARILLDDPDKLAKTDIADHALEKLRASNIREVAILGRRGIAQAAFTIGEFLAMGDLPGVDVIIDPAELVLDNQSQSAEDSGTLDSSISTRLRIARDFAGRAATDGNKRVVFRFLVSPTAIAGDGKAESITLVRNEFVEAEGRVGIAATDETETLETGLVMRAVGYKGVPVAEGVPFDEVRGVIPNEGGRVLDAADGQKVPGLYVTGWIKRGATGGIGRNRQCGEETAHAVIEDFIEGVTPTPSGSRDDVVDLVTGRGANVIDGAGWKNIDAAEKAAGKEAGRRRVKFVKISDMEAAAQG